MLFYRWRYCIVWICHVKFTHSSTDKHFGLFPFLPVRKNTSISTRHCLKLSHAFPLIFRIIFKTLYMVSILREFWSQWLLQFDLELYLFHSYYLQNCCLKVFACVLPSSWRPPPLYPPTSSLPCLINSKFLSECKYFLREKMFWNWFPCPPSHSTPHLG